VLKYALQEPFCKLLWNKIYISPNGQFRNCCLQNCDLGNIFNKSWHEIWHSNVLTQSRQNIINGQVPEICKNRGCPYLFKKNAPCCQISDNKYPEILELGLPNTWCNIGGSHPKTGTACFMCLRSSPNFIPDDETVFWKIVDILKEYICHLKILIPLGLAEVFWKKRLWLVLNRLNYKPYAEDITLTITSNATVFNQEVQKEYLDTIPHSCSTFSIDAATASTYEKIRKLSCFDQVIQNVIHYANHPDRNKKTQLAGVNYNINMLNIHECEEMVKMWHGIPIDGVIFTPTLPFGCVESYKYIINETNWQEFRKAKLKILETADKFSVPVDFFTEFEIATPVTF
jgi:MoaA/NifB/PqqE/SkfB family radical SAM enzyme